MIRSSLAVVAAVLTMGVAAAFATYAQTSSPLLLVLNKDDATLSFINAGDGTTMARVATGEAPHEIVVSTDGKLAFVSNYGTGPKPGTTISVIDVNARKELRRVDLGALRRPHGLAYAAGKLYLTAEANRVVARYDPAANQIDWILGTGQTTTHMVIVDQDATRLFTANIGSDSVSVLERGSGPLDWSVMQIPVGRGPEGIDVTPDGRQLWAAHSRDGGVSIVDLAQKKVIGTFEVGTKRSNRLKFTPDGQRVLISDLDGGELIAIDVASRKVVKRLPLGRMVEGVLIVPDGSQAYVAVAGENHLAVVDLKTLEVKGQIATGAGPDGMAYVKIPTGVRPQSRF